MLKNLDKNVFGWRNRVLHFRDFGIFNRKQGFIPDLKQPSVVIIATRKSPGLVANVVRSQKFSPGGGGEAKFGEKAHFWTFQSKWGNKNVCCETRGISGEGGDSGRMEVRSNLCT